MGCCMSSAVYITPPHELAVNKLDQHLQRKQGLKTAEQLSKQNGKYAEDPTEWRKRKEKDFSAFAPKLKQKKIVPWRE